MKPEMTGVVSFKEKLISFEIIIHLNCIFLQLKLQLIYRDWSSPFPKEKFNPYIKSEITEGI